MSDETKEEVPGVSFMNLFVLMEEFLEKLKLLEYEKEFCHVWGYKQFSRHFFAVPTNPGEQFPLFTNIVVWLLQKCSKTMQRPQEYDDPNATVSEILTEARSLGISVDFPPSKLKSGSGEQVVYLLNKLSDEALKLQQFQWSRPEYMQEEEPEENIIEDDSELTIDKLNDELAEEIVEEVEDEECFLDLSGLKQHSILNEFSSSKPESVMESKTNIDEWKLEVERVLPLLKIHIRADGKDWRGHYEQMQQYSKGIKETLQSTQSQLDKLHQEISKTLEKVASREKYINSQLETQLNEYRGNTDKLNVIQEKYKQSSGGVTELTQKLAQITDELETVKMQMDERGTNMTDSGPLVRIKQALAKLNQECTEMEVQIGVLEHSLLQGKLREKLDIESKVNKLIK